MTNQLGVFRIHGDLIERQPELLAAHLFSQCVILRAEHLWAERVIEYTAWSEMFAEVAEGIITPRYDIIFQRHDDGSVSTWAEPERGPGERTSSSNLGSQRDTVV